MNRDKSLIKKYQIKIRILEERLRSIEQRYCSFMDLSPDAIFIQTRGNFVSVNKAALKLYGVKNEKELIGRSVFDFIHPDYHPIVHERIKRLAEGKSVNALEQKFIRANGEIVDVQVLGTPFMLDGKFAVEVLVRDISEQKKVQRLLEEKNIALRELLAGIEDEKKLIREQVMMNVDTLIRPYLHELKKKSTVLEQKQINFIEASLQRMTDSFGPLIKRYIEKLSPKEVMICGMIRKNLANKEIARLLKISPMTVGTHRNRIRKKLGLPHSTNLTVYLQKN